MTTSRAKGRRRGDWKALPVPVAMVGPAPGRSAYPPGDLGDARYAAALKVWEHGVSDPRRTEMVGRRGRPGAPETGPRPVDSVGERYGMSASDVLAHIATGDRRNPDAPDMECGAIDPRDEAGFCRRPRDHGTRGMGGDHCGYLLDSDWPDLATPLGTWPVWWGQHGGNTPAERKARGW